MTETNPNLIPYRVMLHEEPGDKFQLVFECMAEDDDHAVEQAENAYPGCDIISYLPFDNSPLLYVIYSPNESAINAGTGFWSNEDGWTELDEASKFSHSEMQTLNLPVSTGQDAKWVLFDEAREHYGQIDALGNSCESECVACVGCSGDKQRSVANGNVGAVANALAGEPLIYEGEKIKVSKDINLFRFSRQGSPDDFNAVHVLVDACGGFEAILNPGSQSTRSVKGSLNDNIKELV